MSQPRKGLLLLAAVVSLSFTACSGEGPKISAQFNQTASLAGEIPANPLQWKVVSAEINKADSSMSTLYGNDLAVVFARAHSQHDYPAGSVLASVTWTQTEDARWFGAKIPDQVKSVEFVRVADAAQGQRSYSYEKYEGTPLKKSSSHVSTTPTERTAYLLSQRAAIMP
jgi:hypothetical protein